MNAKELRIGNWVKIPHRAEAQVTGLTNTNKIWLVDNPTHTECAWDKLEPIPLTEEWLLKFGFECDDEDDDLCYWKTEFDTYGNESEPIDLIKTIYGYHHTAVHSPLEYVHQLQNLYFALTGEELTI